MNSDPDATESGGALLRAVDVARSFIVGGERVDALHPLSCSLRAGRMMLAVGPSGCGKSTLLALMGLMDRPSQGEVLFEGSPTAHLTEAGRAALRRRSIGFVFQDHRLLAGMSLARNVGLGLVYRGVAPARQRDMARAALARVGLGHRGDHSADEISGGERARAALARALAHEPAILIADEPTASLDPGTSARIRAELRAFRDQGGAVLVASHDASFRDDADDILDLEAHRAAHEPAPPSLPAAAA